MKYNDEVSTFAWYAVSNAVVMDTLTDDVTISTAAHTALDNAPIDAEMEGTATLKLTNNLGASNYISNNNTYPDNDGNKVGSFTVSVDWDEGFAGTGSNYNGAQTEFWIVPAGNVVILATNNPSLNNAADPAQAIPYVHVTVTVTNGSPVADVTSVQFAIRTNNASGKEFVKSDETLVAAGQVISTTNLETDGVQDVLGAGWYNSSTYAVRKCTAAGEGNDAGTWTDSGYLHVADDLSLTTTDPSL